MGKLRLDLDSIRVEAFATTPADGRRGTLFGQATAFQTRCQQTCNLDTTCYGNTDIDNLCTGDCTGIGVECYTADPVYFACTGGVDCTGAAACTNTGCTVNNPTCAAC